MKLANIPATVQEYEKFIKSSIISSDIYYSHPFYDNLIRFIINERSPIFVQRSHEYEIPHFLLPFGILYVKPYDNAILRDLHYAHDFVHFVFKYELSTKNLTYADYHAQIVGHETVASNDSEILSFYRLPELRKLLLQNKVIIADELQRITSQTPTVQQLIELRDHIRQHSTAIDLLISPQATSYVREYDTNNVLWTSMWYKTLLDNDFKIPFDTFISYDTYIEKITNYSEPLNQQKYEQNTINICRNVALYYGEMAPSGLKDCQELFDRHNGDVMFDLNAQQFYRIAYQQVSYHPK